MPLRLYHCWSENSIYTSLKVQPHCEKPAALTLVSLVSLGPERDKVSFFTHSLREDGSLDIGVGDEEQAFPVFCTPILKQHCP